MQSIDKVSTASAPVATELGIANDLTVPYIMGIVRRNWLLPFIGCLLGVSAALTYITVKPTRYASTARILIDRSVNRYLQANKIIDEPILDDVETGSQIYVLSSESIIVPVIRSMNLARDPEFVGKVREKGKQEGWSLTMLYEQIQFLVGKRADPSELSEATLERVAVEEFLKRLSVYREDVQSVISVTFESEEAQKAANVVNAIVDRYFAAHQDAKSKSTKMATQLLKLQLTELKQQTTDSERLLQEFIRDNKLEISATAANSPDQIAALRAQLSASLAVTAEAKARLEHARQPQQGAAYPSSVADNEVTLKLRSQYLADEANAADIADRVGAGHVAVKRLRQKMEELRKAISREQQRISDRYQTEYELAKARSDQYSEALSKLVLGTGEADSTTRVRLRELESRADTLRTAYSSVLQRLNDVSKNEAPVSQDVRVITRAAAPLRKAPRGGLKVLAGGVGLGLLLGLGAALGRELIGGVIRTPRQIRDITDCYCAIVPSVKFGHGLTLKARPPLLEEYVLDAPFSRFTEAFRNARVLLTTRHMGRTNRGNVICIVSAVAKEGKTMVATNLAALMASSSGLRVLLIDGDLHLRGLTRALAPQAKEGLIEALDEPSRLPALIVRKERSGVELLPCPLPDRLANAAERLGSSHMERLIRKAREDYDFIIVEAPPIMSVVDVKMLERHIDQFVLVVEWGSTKERLVKEAVAEVEGLYDRLSCVILNKVDPSVLKTIESYKGPHSDTYYEA